MEKTAGRILKGNTVKLEGRFRLDATVSADTKRTNQVSTNERNVTSAPAQVRIVENQPEFAVMEVTCGCGAKTQIRCEYAEAQSDDQEPKQENNGENNNAS